MTGVRITCEARIKPEHEERFKAFVAKIQEVVRVKEDSRTTVYEYYRSVAAGELCYIHEGYGRLSDFIEHMATIRPLFLEYGDTLEVNRLDICGDLTADLIEHFTSLYGAKFQHFGHRMHYG